MKPWKEFLEINSIKEDASANMASGGHIAGLGDDLPGQPGSGEPGFYPKKKKKEDAVRHDGRTKGYREHRQKLEAAREKRKNRKELQDQKFADDIQNKTLKMSWPSTGAGPVPDTASHMAAMQNSNLEKKVEKGKSPFKKRTT
jgi:hypothetical protein